MGIFRRMKRAVKSKANAAIDKAVDPAKEIEMVIAELEEQRRVAYKELLGYKTSAKQMERDMAELEEKAAKWEKRAMAAVKAGDDDTARQCLKEHKEALAERERVQRDRDEAAGYAIELNRSRKKVEHRLKILKLKKGTMATQIAAARSRSGSTFGETNELFERFDAAGDAIDEEAIEAEVAAAMAGEDHGTELESKVLAVAAKGGEQAGAEADDELARLKAKMLEEREAKAAKQLGE
jgi:phage shock protein A